MVDAEEFVTVLAVFVERIGAQAQLRAAVLTPGTVGILLNKNKISEKGLLVFVLFVSRIMNNTVENVFS